MPSAQVKSYSIVETLCIVVIFVINGLVLKTEELLAAIKHPFPLLYGLVAILAVTPMIGFATIRIPFQPPEFAVGEPSGLPCRCCYLLPKKTAETDGGSGSMFEHWQHVVQHDAAVRCPPVQT